jgi:hypothetical protein
MAIVKLIAPGSYNFREPVAQLIKMSKRGLRGPDLGDFVKRASVQFIDKMASMQLAPGEVPVHLIALGAEEYFGFNRNGDGFKEAVCQKYHPTFVKYARWYRDHQNKDKSKGRGIIKASAYNGTMRRIELLVALNGTKEAADRNGGLVADEELEKLARGEDIPVSMACRVSHDVCSSCGNKAKSRAEYCGPEMCKYGGCRDNLAKTFDDGYTLGVFNDDPAYFDISKVFRPADRIAYTLGMAKAAADYQALLKEAADTYGAERSSAVLAERMGVTAPLWLMADGPWADPRLTGQLKVANDLIALEDSIAAEKMPSQHDRAFAAEVQPTCTDVPDVRTGPFKLAHVMTALAAERCLLPLESFLALLTGNETSVKTAADRVAERLPGVYNRLASDPGLENELRNNPYLPGGPAPRRIRHWVLKHAAEWSLDRPSIVQRLQLSTLRRPRMLGNRRPMTKVAMAGNVDEMARHYALYQLGFLHANAAAPDAGFMKEMVVRSNFVR